MKIISYSREDLLNFISIDYISSIPYWHTQSDLNELLNKVADSQNLDISRCSNLKIIHPKNMSPRFQFQYE